MSKQAKSLHKLNKQTDLKGQNNFIEFKFSLYVADPATLLASNSALGTSFPSENSLFIQLWKKKYYYHINLVNVTILSLKFFSKTTQCPFKHWANQGVSVYQKTLLELAAFV